MWRASLAGEREAEAETDLMRIVWYKNHTLKKEASWGRFVTVEIWLKMFFEQFDQLICCELR